ncbi:hypothetical protein BsWGS_11601 [Bradybaena similaris]
MEVRLQVCLAVTGVLLVTSSLSQENPDIKDCLPPNIIKQATSGILYFISGTKVEIPCKARGDGELTYTWLKDGVPLDLNSPYIKDRAFMNSGVGTLSITAQETDEGIYQCSVTNECGTSLSHKTMLDLAGIFPFPKLDKPVELKRFQGASLILTCNPPESVPKAKITWILIDSQTNRNYNDINEDSQGFITVPLSKRVTMDYNGNLYITNVQKEDEQGGKTYVCEAENTFIRSKNKGEDKRITVYDNPAPNMGVELMWHSDTETLALEGRSAKFKCIFSGQPEPSVSWMKGISSPDKSRSVYDNNELIINDVQFQDAGEYTCMARNQISKDFMKHTFTLTVEAAPAWKVKPREVTVGVEESAVFECDATGHPTPTVEWFINGRPYADVPASPRRSLSGNTLSFSRLEKDDSQVIQCNASNIHGSIWSDVFLYVQALPPVIKEKPADEMVVAEGQDVKVPCLVTGKPKPRIIWYKGNQQLIHERFEILPNGYLLIKKTEKKDTGTYKCFAENKFGEASASGKITVRERTRIETTPMDSKVDYTNSVIFTCGATTDPMESAKLRIRWLKDGVELQPSHRVSINGGVLTINETNSKDTAMYTCVADNGLDNDTATATLQVKAVPDPPYNVSLKECLATRATIEWKFDEKMSNFDIMLKYIVEYSTEYKRGVWVELVSAQYPTNRVTVDLSPFAKYSFRVRAVNMMGTSEPSEPSSSSCETPMSVPDKNPGNVYTDESYTGFLVVKWSPVEQIDQNGPNFRYVVEVQEQGTQKVEVFEVTDYRITEKHIPVENIFRPYIIKVRSENQVGKASNEPSTIIGYSGEAPPLVVPDNFELDPDVNVTATSAGFRWDPVDTSPDMIRGEFSGYKIRFWKADEKETSLHEHIISPEPSNKSRKRRNSLDGKVRGMVANLPSYAEILADVVVINRKFESNGSNTVNFSTPEGVPGRVEFLKAAYRGSHHFLLQWGKPTKPNGIILGYQISFQKISRLDVGPKTTAFEDIDPEQDQVELKDLEPDTQYRISITARTVEGFGEEFFIDVKTISDVSQLAKPVIQNVFPGDNNANVTWNMTTEKGGRYPQLYYIEYLKKNSTKWVRIDHPVESQNWGMLEHLEPGTEYDVRVVAMSHVNGVEKSGNTIRFMTAGMSAAKASFLTATWFIGMMVAIAVLILILVIVCIVKRNKGDNYPVQEKERLRGNYTDENPDHFDDYGKGDENGIKGSGSFDQDAEKVPLDEDVDSLDYGDDEGSKFNEDGSFIGQYGTAEKENETNASSIV